MKKWFKWFAACLGIILIYLGLLAGKDILILNSFSYENLFVSAYPAGIAPWYYPTALIRYYIINFKKIPPETRILNQPVIISAIDGCYGKIQEDVSCRSMVDYFLKEGADINATDVMGYTALHGAVRIGDLPLAHFLVERGADVNHPAMGRFHKGMTPLGLAELLKKHSSQNHDPNGMAAAKAEAVAVAETAAYLKAHGGHE